MVYFAVPVNGTVKRVYPEDIGAILIGTLRQAAANNLSAPVTKVVISVPAEFDQRQRNYTRKAANLAGNGAPNIDTYFYFYKAYFFTRSYV